MRESKIGTRLRPLVQLIPAAAVAAVVLVTLPQTQPVLAAIPERLAASEAPSSVAEPEEEEEDALPKLPYADGIYTGHSRGYGGQVTVQVTMEGGYITDLQILDASHETSAFLKRSRRLLNIVMTSQTWEVDAVSEATYTSRGILGAIQNALTGEEVINPLPPQPTPAEPPVIEDIEISSEWRDGVYTASAEGFGGPITVQVTIADGVIIDITVLDHAGETSSYFYRARHVVADILEAGSPDVDSISGATYSSTGIINAVKLALAKASTDPDAGAETPDTSEAGQPAEPQYVDGVYTGTSGGVTVSVTVTDGSVASVDVLPQEDESPSFFARVKAALEAFFSGQQPSAGSDGPTEEEIAAAIQAALQQAQAGTTETPASSAAEEPAESAAASEPEAPESAPAESEAASAPAATAPQYRDGSYSAVAVCTDDDEFHYDVRVDITVSGGSVTSVLVTKENDTSESPEDNRRYLDRAKNGRTVQDVVYEGLVSQIMRRQSADEADLISGATYSSQAIQSAAQQALAQAKQPEGTVE